MMCALLGMYSVVACALQAVHVNCLIIKKKKTDVIFFFLLNGKRCEIVSASVACWRGDLFPEGAPGLELRLTHWRMIVLANLALDVADVKFNSRYQSWIVHFFFSRIELTMQSSCWCFRACLDGRR